MNQNAVVVPVLRLRRDTAGWSYKIPSNAACLPGSLVIVPFRNRPTLGVVWELRQDDLAQEQISQVLTSAPLVLALQRQLIEYLAEAGLISLSTALYVWLPRWLRSLPLTKGVQQRLREPTDGSNQPQQAILLPGRRPVQEQLLASRNPALLFSDVTEAQLQQNWWNISTTKQSLGIGREGALFAPWHNLQQLLIVEPEDISYYHEQTPYLPLVAVACELARINRITPQWRSTLPTVVAQTVWGEGARGNDLLPESITHLDLQHQPLLSDTVVELIQATIQQGHSVVILHNAYDRLSKPNSSGRRKAVLGVQGITRTLQQRLGVSELPNSIIIGTRAILQRPYTNVGLTVALNLDQLLDTVLFPEQLHGWSDLGHLFRYSGHCVIQSHQPEHPLIQALLQKKWSEYLIERVMARQTAHLPPFCQQLVVSIKENTPAAGELYLKLQPLVAEPWQLSYPFQGLWRKKEYTHLMLTAPLEERLPAALRKALVAVPSPWKVQRSPWHIM